MPTENEYKYVLENTLIEGDTWQKELMPFMSEFDQYNIMQGYLFVGKENALRIRAILSGHHAKPDHYFLTYKHKVNDRLVEIENEIDGKDWIDLWSKCENKFCKLRTAIQFQGNRWEIDFFRDGGENYFILMEVELPEGSPVPVETPFANYVLLAVDQNDDRFSNTKLCNVEYAKNLYEMTRASAIAKALEEIRSIQTVHTDQA